ncbi:MAG: manganese efflux pump [Peptococcaceae bacterium]|nr:manganese efflux pump [Peptococcaceae bacterium]
MSQMMNQFLSQWVFIAALTISSSLDNVGVGLSYGIRAIRIGFRSNTLISAICFVFSACGIYFGMWISTILPGILPVLLGSFILIIIGIRLVFLGLPRQGKDPQLTQSIGELESLSPDQPRRQIGFLESALLGVALSVNALTNGVGAGLFGFSPLLISFLAAVASFITIHVSTALGYRLSKVHIGRFSVGQFGTMISGFLLMIIAVSVFFH